MAEKIACGYFLSLRNKKLYLYGHGRRTGRMAAKTACGYFLSLRNKKLYLYGHGRRTDRMAEKNSLRLFFILASYPPSGKGGGPQLFLRA